MRFSTSPPAAPEKAMIERSAVASPSPRTVKLPRRIVVSALACHSAGAVHVSAEIGADDGAEDAAASGIAG